MNDDMPHAVKKQPLCLVIAGPNGAGKTTFAKVFLPKEGGIMNFMNADLIAAGLSPLKPELANREAGRIFLREIDRLVAARADFCFETTLSGRAYVARLHAMRAAGYAIRIIFLRLESAELSILRIAERVKQGGHHVPDEDVRRRLVSGWDNFRNTYRELADSWWVLDANQSPPTLLESSNPAP